MNIGKKLPSKNLMNNWKPVLSSENLLNIKTKVKIAEKQQTIGKMVGSFLDFYLFSDIHF